jgi:hypothetical protein
MLVGISQFSKEAGSSKHNKVVLVTKDPDKWGVARIYRGKTRQLETSDEHKSFKTFCKGDWCNGFKLELMYEVLPTE